MSPIFSIIFSRSNGQCQRSKSLKCLVWTCNKLHLVGNSIFRVTYTKQINFLHKHLVFYTVKFKSEVNKYILKLRLKVKSVKTALYRQEMSCI